MEDQKLQNRGNEQAACSECGGPGTPGTICSNCGTKIAQLILETKIGMVGLLEDIMNSIIEVIPDKYQGMVQDAKIELNKLVSFKELNTEQKRVIAMDIFDYLYKLDSALETEMEKCDQKSERFKKLSDIKLKTKSGLRALSSGMQGNELNLIQMNIEPRETKYHKLTHDCIGVSRDTGLMAGTIVSVKSNGFWDKDGKTIRKPKVVVAGDKA